MITPLSAFIVFIPSLSLQLPRIEYHPQHAPKPNLAFHRDAFHNSVMYVHDAATRKDRLLLTFASAVGCCYHSNFVMLML